MNRFIIILSILLLPISLSAKLDDRKPGLYAIVGEQSVPLRFTRSSVIYNYMDRMQVRYKRKTSSVTASNTFVLVTDPNQIMYRCNEPYASNFDPGNIIILPLNVNNDFDRREYDVQTYRTTMGTVAMAQRPGVEFEWEKISDNSYIINVKDIVPGEYGISTRIANLSDFDYQQGIFDFSIASEGAGVAAMEAPTAQAPAEGSEVTPAATVMAATAPMVEEAPKVTLWNGGYDKSWLQFVIGYVNKTWYCTYQSGERQEDFFGETDSKYLHGFQIGALFTPAFDWGLGLRTGLVLESYISKKDWILDFCDHFTEADLYIPLQASFNIPFKESIGLNLFGGMGFQWAFDGRYFKRTGTSWSWYRRPMPVGEVIKQPYGNGWPQRVNWQAECGLCFRYDRFALSFTYSFGVTDHGIQTSFDDGETYETASRSRQDKMQASVMILF